jgi:hypothetical protein
MRSTTIVSVFLALSSTAWLGAPASAQSFNLDVGDNLILSPVPSSAYGAAAGQPGFWNLVKNPYSVTLTLLNGSLSGATVASSGTNSFNYPGFAANDDQNLMYDCQDINQFSGTVTWTFSGFSDGSYRVYTYAWDPVNSGAHTSVNVPGSPDPAQIVGGIWTGSPHVLGVTYARHQIDVSGGTFTVEVAGSGASGSINGFQIVQDSSAFTPFCAGDNTAFPPCPCGNTGLLDHGCNNSAGTGGALLGASGNTSPDTVVLTSSSELPSVLSIFLQGQAGVFPGVLFGDGVRCVNGTLKRLYQKNASGGTVSAPTGAEPSITARSAALGDTILPGTTRYYQVYYRDSNLGFCPSPMGDSWNVSSGISIAW